MTCWLHALPDEKYPITAQSTSLGTTAHVNDLACHLLGAIDVPKVVCMPVPRTQEQIQRDDQDDFSGESLHTQR